MNQINKVSDITAYDCAEYIRIYEPDAYDISTLTNLIQIAKAFIKQYTGRTDEEMDSFQDLVIVVLILVQDMWDNRTMYVDTTNLNFTVDSILHSHSVNLL